MWRCPVVHMITHSQPFSMNNSRAHNTFSATFRRKKWNETIFPSSSFRSIYFALRLISFHFLSIASSSQLYDRKIWRREKNIFKSTSHRIKCPVTNVDFSQQQQKKWEKENWAITESCVRYKIEKKKWYSARAERKGEGESESRYVVSQVCYFGRLERKRPTKQE